MQASQITFGVVAILFPALVMLSWHYWARVHEALGVEGTRGYMVWLIKGLVVPMAVWTLLHTGWISGMPPLAVAGYSVAPGSVDWLIALPAVLAPSVLVMASFWTAATFLDLLVLAMAQIEDRRDRFGVGGFWLLVTLPFGAFVLYVGGWTVLGFALLVSTVPMVHAFLPLLFPEGHVPLYSRAIARMKFGKYADAEQAVLEELEKATEDFDGWMLLAELYAEHFNDLPQAETTVRDLCKQPDITPLQVSLALHRLADWHLRLAEDPVAARRALATIMERIPDSHFAHMAHLRIRQLPANREALRHQKEVRPIRLPALQDPLDDQDARPPADRSAAAAQANRLVDRLRENPNDLSAREQFARLLAEDLGQADLALEQVDLLLGLPEVPAVKVAEWLSWQAAWHLRFRQDRQAARLLLQRVVREFPDSPQAFPAQRRLSLLDMDARVRQCSAPA